MTQKQAKTEQRKKRSIEEIKMRQKSDSEGFWESTAKLNKKSKK